MGNPSEWVEGCLHGKEQDILQQTEQEQYNLTADRTGAV
jgi:hypothetical protein